MKKNLVHFITSLLLGVLLINAQPTLNGEKNLEATQVVFIERSPKSGGGYDYGSGDYGIGFSASDTILYRSYHEFNLSVIPSNATITEVRIEYYTSTTEPFNFKITQPASVTSNLGSTFESIGNSSVKESGLSYNMVAQYLISNNLKTSLQTALSSGTLYLGTLSHTESGSNSRNIATIKLRVKYTYPATQITLTAKNDMDGYNGGQVKVGWGTSNPKQTRTSPFTFYPYESEAVNLEAIDNQSYSNYNWLYNDSEAPLNKSFWTKGSGYGGTYVTDNSQVNTQASMSENNYHYINYLRKVCSIDFQNQINGTSFNGQIKVNGVWQNSPTTSAVVEQNLISVDLNTHYEDGYIRFIFEKWNDNVTSTSRNLYPNSHTSYTAIYKGYPIFNESSYDGNIRNLQISGTGSQNYIKLTWNEHPNTNVTQYHIYRYFKRPNGTVSSPVHIATKSRGNLSYTDIEYTYNPGSGDFILWYDVRAYYSPDGTTSPVAYVSTKGDQSGTALKIGSGEEITYYDITNYPNPYNPQTTIRFQLPQEGFVTIKVYDAIGKEVATLLNEEKDSGIYELKFNGIDLPSGMYIYTIKVNDYFASKKMLLVK